MTNPVSNDPFYKIQSGYLPSPYGDPNQMITLSNNLIGLTESYIATLQSTVGNLHAPTINPNFPVVSNPPTPVTAAVPVLQTVTWTTPTQPAAFTSSVDISGLLPGPFTGQAPILHFPNPPSPFAVNPPTSPGIDLNFDYPNPAVDLPSAPTLLSLDSVNFNVSQVPSFNVSVPTLTINPPPVMAFNEPSMYASTLLTDLQTSLDQAITSGANLSLPPEIEAALWDREREREYRQQADALADLDRMQDMGFAFPTGVYLDARTKITTETNYTIAGASRDIAIKQAQLLLDNITKARELAVQLEGKFIDYANNIAQRSFEYARYVTQASIAVYNAQVEIYKAQLEGYRVEALVYDTQIKGILAQVDVIKAQIDFEKTKADINTALVEQYKSEVDAAMAVVEIFKLQVDIIQTRANVEKIKVDTFAAQIQAYVGQVNAFTAQVDAYKSEIEAQGVLEQVYKTQVDAYAATVQAGVAEANALVAEYDAQVRAYTAQLDGYKAALEAMVEQARAASLYNEAQANVYRALTEALSAYNSTLTAQWQAVLNEQEKIAEVGVAAAKANGDLYIASEGLILEASKTGATLAAQLGAAALSAIHWANNSSWAISQSTVLEAIESNSTNDNTNTNINT